MNIASDVILTFDGAKANALFDRGVRVVAPVRP